MLLPMGLEILVLLVPYATRRALQMVHVGKIRRIGSTTIRTTDGIADKSLRFLHFSVIFK